MGGLRILERAKLALNTGEWWAIQWWQSDEYYKDGPHTREQARIAFGELARVFDAQWFLQQKTGRSFLHALCPTLLGEGSYFFDILCPMGLGLHDVREAGLLGDLVRRLRNPREYWEAAAFELKFLSYFLQNRFELKRDCPSGKGKHNCDLRISKGDETLFVEIKRPRETHRHSSLDQVFRRIRYAARYQIPDEGGGVVIVESPWNLDLGAFRSRATRRFHNQSKYSPLSAIVLVEISYNNRICHNITPVMNPHAKTDVSSYKAMKLILSLQS